MATVTLRPNGVVSAPSGWSNGTGAGDLADDNDATWYIGNPFYPLGYLTMDMTTSTFPVNTVIHSVTPRIRGSQPTGSPSNQFFGFEVSGTRVMSSYVATSTITTATGTTSTTNPGGGAWTQADIDAIRWVTSNAGAANQNVYEGYLDVSYTVHTAPSVTISAPTGTITTTNQPAVTWVYSDAESDPQTKYKVKIFSSADYSAGGFDPETWLASWYSGEVSSAAVTTTVGTPLPASVTFKAYVQVGDAFSGYGAWTAGPAFSIAATGVDKPGRLFYALTSGPGSVAAGYYEFNDSSREGTYTWKSAPLRDPAGRQVEIREVQVYCRTFDAGATIAVTVNDVTRTVTVAVASRQQLHFLFAERGETLDVKVVSTAGTPATIEAPAIEAIRIGTRPRHLLR